MHVRPMGEGHYMVFQFFLLSVHTVLLHGEDIDIVVPCTSKVKDQAVVRLVENCETNRISSVTLVFSAWIHVFREV